MKLDQLHLDLNRYTTDLSKSYRYQLEGKLVKVEQLKGRLKSPEEKISQLKERHLNLVEKLNAQIIKVKENKVYRFEVLKAALNSLNPLSLMDKGFAVISKDDHVLTSVKQIEVSDEIGIRLKDGSIKARVIRKEEL
jgi:exodeoxyribonuclease VII large subunit